MGVVACVCFLGVIIIVARYRFRDELNIPSDQTTIEILIGIFLFVITVFCASMHSVQNPSVNRNNQTSVSNKIKIQRQTLSQTNTNDFENFSNKNINNRGSIKPHKKGDNDWFENDNILSENIEEEGTYFEENVNKYAQREGIPTPRTTTKNKHYSRSTPSLAESANTFNRIGKFDSTIEESDERGSLFLHSTSTDSKTIYTDSGSILKDDDTLFLPTTSKIKRRFEQSLEITPDAYGPGIGQDQFGRPVRYAIPNWPKNEPTQNLEVTHDVYGPGVGQDQFGRPVYTVPAF